MFVVHIRSWDKDVLAAFENQEQCPQQTTKAMDMDIKEIRLQNLLTLLEKNDSDVEFCRRIEMNPSYLPQIKGRSKSIGDKIARKIEEKLGLERGYMDSVQDVRLLPERIPEADVMATAYSIESMPTSIRNVFKQLVLQVAAHCKNDAETIQPFDVTLKKETQHESDRVSKNQRR